MAVFSARCVSKAFLFLMSAGLVLSASAVKVHNTVNKGDPRYFTTGCKFESALAGGKASIGVWVKNISAHGTPANIFGNLHVNGGYPCGGLMMGIKGTEDAGYFVFTVEGKDANDAWVRKDLSATDSGSLRTDGKWHFLVGTYDVAAGAARFYIDGTLAVENTSLGMASIPSGRCFAGCCVGKKTESTTRDVESYGAGYKGLFSEVTLWNKALSAAEVAALYTRRAAMWEAGLIGYWPMTDNGKDYAFDPATRADGSVPDALFYYELTVEDADFFDACPTTGRFVISPAKATELGYTVPSGCDYSSVTKPATNIQDAVDAATSGQTVYVFSGYYPLTSEILLTGKSVSLKGLDPVTFAPDRDGVVVDGQGQCRTLKISRSDASYRNVVDSLTLSNGNACVRLYNSELFWSKTDKTMELLNCRIVGNRVASGNSGVYLGKQGLVSNCVIVANYSPDSSVFGWTTDYGSVVQYNEPTRANVFRDCFVAGNTCGLLGASILAAGANAALFQGCTFSNNSYTVSGSSDRAMLMLNGDSYARDCMFVDNAPANGRPNSVINLNGGSTMVSNCVFRGNRNASYVLRALENQKKARVEDTLISANGSAGMVGGVSARNVLAVGNGSGYGLQFHAYGVTSRVENCTFVGFSRGVYVGGADADSRLALVNSISANNVNEDYYMNVAIGALAITNSCIATMGCNSGNVPGGVPTELFCNRWTNKPGFKDAANGDYTLKPGAFAREKGMLLPWMTGSSLDLAKNPRLVNRSAEAYAPDALPDLGCYECQEHAPGMILIFR